MQPSLRNLLGTSRGVANDSARHIVLRGAIESMSVRIAGIALSYAAAVLLSRLLGLSGYGRYAIALSWVLVLTLPAKAGFDVSSLRYATIYLELNDHAALRGFVRFAAGAIILLSAVAGGLILLLGQQFAHTDREALVWAALMVMPLALLTLFSALMRVAQRVIAAQSYEQVLRPLLVIAGAGAAAIAGVALTPANALMITALAAFGALLGILLHFRKAFAVSLEHRPHYEAWREWLSVSVPMLVMGVVQELMNHVEVILLGLLADARQAGMFAASWRLASFVPFVFVGLSVMAAPLIASSHERRAFDELSRLAGFVARLGFASAIAGALVLIAAGQWLLGLFGEEFVGAYAVLIVLLIGGVANAFTGVVGYMMILTGRERQALAIFVGALVLSIGLNLLLVPRFGAVGAAAASSSATAAWNLAMLVYVRRVIGIDASALALAPKRAPS